MQSIPIIIICFYLSIFLILLWRSLQEPEGHHPSWTRQGSTKAHLEYIPISSALLGEWTVRDEHLMIIDLRPNKLADADSESIPGALRISPRQLGRYVGYLPAHTRLVLCDKTPISRLDSTAEDALLMIGIQALYVLEGIDGSCAKPQVLWAQGKRA